MTRVRDVEVQDDRLTVRLTDGREISVPLDWFPRLEAADEAKRRNWELIGDGEGIHWPEVDEDISVGSLLWPEETIPSREIRERGKGPRDSADHPSGVGRYASGLGCYAGQVIDEGEGLDRAVRRGAERAVRRHRRLGVPLIYSQDGEVVEVDPWSVELPMVDPETLLSTAEDTHRCEELVADLELYEELGEEWGRAGRGATGPLLWGLAIKRIEKRRGRWFAHNCEYAVPVAYCPFCGTALCASC